MFHTQSEWTAEDNQSLIDHIDRLDDERDSDPSLWTFVYRGSTPHFDRTTRINCMLVDHENHIHVVFQSSNTNKNRTLSRIMQAGRMDLSQHMACLSTLQAVVQWSKFAAYLVRGANTKTTCVGTKLRDLQHELLNVTREEKDCATLLRNERQHKTFDNIKRKRRTDLIYSLVETYDARSLYEFKNNLNVEDRLSLYNEHGPQWQEASKLCIEAYCESIRKQQETTPFDQYIAINNHHRVCAHPSSTLQGEYWLDLLLQVNGINKVEMITDIRNIMDKKLDRINALCIKGPTTTGMFILFSLIAR